MGSSPHRNRCEHNCILDSGIAIDVRGQTEQVTMSRKEIRQTRQPISRIGIRMGPRPYASPWPKIAFTDSHTKYPICYELRVGHAVRDRSTGRQVCSARVF